MRITSRRPPDNDVGIVVRIFGKQFGELCPWIVQLCLVVESINRDCRALLVIGDGCTPEDEVFGSDISKRGSLVPVNNEILQGGDCLCRRNLDFESIRYGFAFNNIEQGQDVAGHGV